jgi:hypothetical protein
VTKEMGVFEDLLCQDQTDQPDTGKFTATGDLLGIQWCKDLANGDKNLSFSRWKELGLVGKK